MKPKWLALSFVLVISMASTTVSYSLSDFGDDAVISYQETSVSTYNTDIASPPAAATSAPASR